MKIGFAGAGHLAICHAVAAAMRGFDVACWDTEVKFLFDVEPLPTSPVSIADEPALIDAWTEATKRITIATSHEVLADCKVVFIARDVEKPEDEKPVADIIGTLHHRLSETIPFVVISQVSPGFTRGYDFKARDMYYQLDPIICGQGYERCYKPERFIVGCSSMDISVNTNYIFYLLAFQCSIYLMTFEEAEFSKLAINTMLAAQVAVTNELASCAQDYKADWAKVAVALQTDARIGPRAYLRPGKVGGHLPRDVRRISEHINPDFIKFLYWHIDE